MGSKAPQPPPPTKLTAVPPSLGRTQAGYNGPSVNQQKPAPPPPPPPKKNGYLLTCKDLKMLKTLIHEYEGNQNKKWSKKEEH